MTILCDAEIRELSRTVGLISPIRSTQCSRLNGRKVPSFGPDGFGYSIRLSSEDFRIFRSAESGTVIDPMNFNPEALEQQSLRNGCFVIPAHGYALGFAVERLRVPSDMVVNCIGKSTYARAGLIVNVTPAEPGWRGYLTLEISNSSPADTLVYADAGIAQLQFLQGRRHCDMPYDGKYQDQRPEVTLPR